MIDTEEQLIQKAYDAFNKRDIDTALSLMHPQVQWPNGWEGGYVNGHDEVRAYWTRQWQAIDPHVAPVAITKNEDGRVNVSVHQVVKDRDGKLLFDGLITHRYTFENGLIVKMEIEQP